MRGSVTVTENALASLLGLAAHEVPGVVGMAPASLREGLQKILGRAQAREGIVLSGEGERVVDVYVVVAYGVAIDAVADNVRERIRHAARTLAGEEIDRVRVHVVGVSGVPGRPGSARKARGG